MSRALLSQRGSERRPKRQAKAAASSKTEHGELDKRLQHDERFLKRIESARRSIRAGRGRRLEDIEA